jgi:hypothetical protein
MKVKKVKLEKIVEDTFVDDMPVDESDGHDNGNPKVSTFFQKEGKQFIPNGLLDGKKRKRFSANFENEKNNGTRANTFDYSGITTILPLLKGKIDWLHFN